MLTVLGILAGYLFGGWVSWRWRLAYRPPHNGIWYDDLNCEFKEEGAHFLRDGPAKRRTRYAPLRNESESYGPCYPHGYPPVLTYILDQFFWLPRLVWYEVLTPIARLGSDAFAATVARHTRMVERHVAPELESGDVLAEEFEALEENARKEAANVEDLMNQC